MTKTNLHIFILAALSFIILEVYKNGNNLNENYALNALENVSFCIWILMAVYIGYREYKNPGPNY